MEGGESMKVIWVSLIVVCIVGVAVSQSGDVAKGKTPVLVELFTSEGCSSCPPADGWLQWLDKNQPFPGVDFIVLSEHVDYWDHDGWKDTYSSPQFTARQAAYVRAMGLKDAYTPQVIVDGRSELNLSDTAQVNHVLHEAAKAPFIPIHIGAVTVDGGSQAVLRAHIDIDGATEKHNSDIYAVIAIKHAESQVLHGENGGRRLQHVSVAQEPIRVGKLERGKPFSGDLKAKLNPGMDPANLRLVVFVQEQDSGSVDGAAVQELGALHAQTSSYAGVR